MYETTISAPQTDRHILEYIRSQTLPIISEMDGITTDIADSHRCYYAIACSDTFRFQLKRILSENVSQAIALGYKNIFVRKFLHVSVGNFFQNVLIDTMCIFDRVYDYQAVAKVLDVEQPMFIDGYYNFRMQLLKRKWCEIAKLVADNSFIMQDRELIMEFLQYLLDSISEKVTNLTLSFESDGFLIYDSQNSVLPDIKTLAPSPTVEEEAAINILLLKPRHLTILFKTRPSEDFCLLMSQLFSCELKKEE